MLSLGFSDQLFNTNDDNFIPFNETSAIAVTEQADLPIENNLRRLIERGARGIVIARNTQFSKHSLIISFLRVLISYLRRSWKVSKSWYTSNTCYFIRITINIAKQNNVQYKWIRHFGYHSSCSRDNIIGLQSH